MKRPMAVIGITYLLAQLTAIAVGSTLSVVFAVAAAAFAALSFVLLSDKHRRIVLPVLVSCAIAFCAYSVYYAVKVKPAQHLYGQTIYIEGEVVQEPYSSNSRFYYVVDTDYIESTKEIQHTRIRISSSLPVEAEISDIFKGTVVVNAPARIENFSRETARIAKGIILTAYIPFGNEIETEDGSHNFRYFIGRLRKNIDKHINLLLDGDLAGLLKGVLLGDKSDISRELINDFRVCGLSHLLAVSGLHMSIIVFCMTVILRHLEISYRPLAAILIAFVWFYMALSGFSYSVLRAGIMTTFMLTARVLNREGDLLSSFGSAILLICLFNPCAAADAGLLLSASSTLGLITLSSKINKRICSLISSRINDRYGVIKMIVSAVIPSLIATACASPVLMLYFGEYSLVSPLANLICVFFANIFLIFGAMAVAVSYIPLIGTLFAKIIITVPWVTGGILKFVAGILGNMPNASIPVNYTFLPVFFAGAAIMFVLCYFLTKGSENRFRQFCICLLIIIGVFFGGVITEYAVRQTKHQVTVYNVENGIAIAAVSGYDCVVVGTGGDRYLAWQMSTKIQDYNISRVDALFYPDSSDVYASYANEFIEDLAPENVYIPSTVSDSDDLSYAVRNIPDSVSNISSASYSNRSNKLQAEAFTDSDGKVWIYIKCGKITTLVCPENGDCSLLPVYMRNPWCAVVMSDDIINQWALNASVIIVSADNKECANSEALLRYRGAETVYTTAHGNITVSEYAGGMLIGGENNA